MTDPLVVEAAHLTPHETEALRLSELGWGYRRIARHLDIAMTTARDRVKAAERKLERAMREAQS